MAGYLIANIDVTDPAKFEEYREKVVPVIEKFGGRYLVRGSDVRRLEGNLPLHRLVVLEFPTLETAQRFYDSAEYQPLSKAPARQHAIGRGACARLFTIRSLPAPDRTAAMYGTRPSHASSS